MNFLKRNALLLIVIGWVILTLFNYYYVNFFILAFEWLGLILTLFIFTILQIIRLIKERKQLTKPRIKKVIIYTILFFLTFFKSFTNGIIEKGDWFILKNKREEVVNQVLRNELNPNVTWNSWVCQLPFEFPVLSNGGNDIGIYRNKSNGKTTVTFWVFRNFFDSPSTQFEFTNDPRRIEQLEKRIIEKPDGNWKLKENWYRTYGH